MGQKLLPYLLYLPHLPLLPLLPLLPNFYIRPKLFSSLQPHHKKAIHVVAVRPNFNPTFDR